MLKQAQKMQNKRQAIIDEAKDEGNNNEFLKDDDGTEFVNPNFDAAAKAAAEAAAGRRRWRLRLPARRVE